MALGERAEVVAPGRVGAVHFDGAVQAAVGGAIGGLVGTEVPQGAEGGHGAAGHAHDVADPVEVVTGFGQQHG